MILLLGMLFALPANAQFASPTWQSQVGAGVGVSVTLGEKADLKSRFHGIAQVFVEAATASPALNAPPGAVPFPADRTAVVPGLSATLRWRRGAELEVAGRLGFARVAHEQLPHHLILGRVSVEAGLAWIRDERAVVGLGGLEGRYYLIEARNRFRTGGHPETLDLSVVADLAVPRRQRIFPSNHVPTAPTLP